jgi:hypothetical protein
MIYMQKYFISKILTLTMLTILATFSACQKQQEETSAPTIENSLDELAISAQATSIQINGLISKDAAERMAKIFNETYKTPNTSQHVSFSTKDLGNYLDLLRKKYKSDSVYVGFGIYDAKTAVKKTDIGRITVFFKGKNRNTVNGNVNSQSVANQLNEGSNYFNHGSIWP